MNMLVPMLALSALLWQPTPTEPSTTPASTGRVEVFDGVTVDFDTKTVEVDGFVPVDAHQEDTPEINIELIAEAHGVRDFEALVRVTAEARQVHAALLMLGLEPGSPGRIEGGGDQPLERIKPTGPELSVRVRFERDGAEVIEDPTEWVVDLDTGKRFSEMQPRFFFAGSSFRQYAGEEWYMARAEGTLVGLCTFGTEDGGTETIGCTPVLSPQTESGDPYWIADPDRIPEFGQRVTLLLRVIEPEQESGENATSPSEE